jgi:phosphoglycerol transferase MdoB-like AlkP superfamily enzyme
MGFDEFHDQSAFDNPNRIGRSPYISDESVYDKALEVLEQDEEKKFITLITMQNHTPYDQIFDDSELQFRVDGKANKEIIEGYLQSLHASDAALGDLVAKLRASEKKVVLVFFGDHEPGIYDELVGTSEDKLTHMTPLVIWKNYDENGDLTEIPDMVSPNQISNLMFEVMGAQKPFLYYLLDDVLKTAPVLARPYSDIKPDEALNDYEFVNYQYFANLKTD